MLALNAYDALGRLKSKKVGGTDISGGAPLQIVDYKYNIRGWLTDINNIDNLARQGNDPQNLFAFKINYTEVTDDINGAVLPLCNGNIAETFWKTSSDNILRKYGYSYDYQNRLLAAFYQKPTTTIPRADSYSTEYSYDRNGNILSLKRNGQRDMATQVLAIDDLDYAYDAGNRLQKVFDGTNHPAGFNMNGAGANEKFVYDKYGNLIADPYKKISNIVYNHLNLPTKITFSSGGKIEYFYACPPFFWRDATGIKLKKKVTDGSTITTTEYMDGFQYTNNTLDFFPHSEGYVKALPAGLGGGTSYDFKYVFTYTDHLGNIRLKYAQDPSNNNQISILEEDHYYPYGFKHSGYNSFHQIFTNDDEKGPGTGIVLTPVNPFLGDSYKYKFGGKEYQTEFDINTYDFGARNYDPALGRWMNLDPLAEMMRRHSPYNYAFNNPVFFTDPDGMSPISGGSLVPDTNSLGTSDTSMGGFGTDVKITTSSGKVVNGYIPKNDDTYKAGKNGKIDKVDDKQYTDSKGNTVDRLYATDKKGNMTKDYVEVGSGALSTKKDGSGTITKDGKSSSFKYQSLSFGNKIVEAEKVFKFLAKFTNVEFSLVQERNSNNISQSRSTVFTSFEGLEEYQGPRYARFAAGAGYLYRFDHSHPLSNFPQASQSDYDNKRAVLGLNKSQQVPSFNILYGGNYYGY